MFEKFDGSSRVPRPIQNTALDWLGARVDKKRKVIVAPTGSGKSGILRAYQLERGGVIVPPVNVLADQLESTYPEVNMLKGLSNYQCPTYDTTCEDVRDFMDGGSCGDCKYTRCRQKVLDAEPSIVNPLALYYAKMGNSKDLIPADYKTVMIDEAHRYLSMLELLCSAEFSHSKYKFPDKFESMLDVAKWLTTVAQQYADLVQKYRAAEELKKMFKAIKRLKTITQLRDGIRDNPRNYVHWTEERKTRIGNDTYLMISPVEVPRSIVDTALGYYDEIVLTSATLPKRWAFKLLGTTNFEYLELDSPIPVENRPVLINPSGLTAKSDAGDVAAWIKKQIKLYPGNTIVHVTYSMAQRLTKFFPHALTHTSDTKDTVMAKFKAEGGLWLAPGCAEGIDLPGKQGEVNLIPILPFQNVGSPLVAARLALPGGNADYELETLVNTIQMAGRTTRGADDRSTTVIGDARIMRLIQKHKEQIPRSFVDAVKYVR
jgi:Rad3-related DNA helicase